MEKLFKLKENETSISTEVMAGITTFFAMSYILFVNPQILSVTGMPVQAIFLATIFSSIVGTLAIALIANVPYALAPGMGLNAFFAYTIVLSLGYTWEQALAMVFLSGIINMIIAFTSLRKAIILGIPESLQHAIGGGIGVFIAYIGIKDAGLLQFISDPGTYTDNHGTITSNSRIVPGLAEFNDPALLVALAGIAITIFFVLRKWKAGILLSIFATSLLAMLVGVVQVDFSTLFAENNLGQAFKEFGTTFAAAFGPNGMQSLFTDSSKILEVVMSVLALSLASVFDPVGTFIGTGRRTGIFTDQDLEDMENSKGFDSKMDKALLANMIATPIGAILGTSNTTVFVESAAGIGVGGRTGLSSVVTAGMFAISMLFLPLLALVPIQATAPILIIVGMMMIASFKEINWTDLTEAIPCFFASVFMGFAYSISDGIAAGFIMYILVKVFTGKAKEVKPIIWGVSALFIINFAALALL